MTPQPSEDAALAAPPRDNIVRAVMPGVELRSAEDGVRTLHGHFAKFNEWTEIRSAWEGNFIERIAPGAFRKTMAESRDRIKVLFDHGHDPSIGNKPLGAIRSLDEDEQGAAYEVDLLDTSYVRDLLPGLEAGLYGASFRFSVVREDKVDRPDESEHNPRGLPERTIREVRLSEFGPVTFPAYAGATAGVRSITDDYIVKRLQRDPDTLRSLLAQYLPIGEAAPAVHAGESHLDPARRDNGQFDHFAAWQRKRLVAARTRAT